MNTEVRILGKTYAVRSEFDPTFTTETADFLNTKMQELVGKSGTLVSEKIAVLTAMNLAGEFLKLKKENDALRENLRRNAKRVLALIDSQL